MSLRMTIVLILIIFLIRYLIILIFFIKNSLLGSLILIIISIFIRLYIAILRRKWISYLIILLFLGGIIVLFVYICTLVSSFKTFIRIFSLIIIIFRSIRAIFIIVFFSIIWDFKIELKRLFLSILYSNSNLILIVFCILYLLIVLITSIKISQKFKGRLKSKLYEI